MKKKIFFTICFLLFLVILFLSPICGDDWSNYLIGIKGLKHIIGVSIGMYFDWEGRFVSRILINLLTCNKIAWNIINSLVIISIIYFVIKIINPKHKKIIYLLSLMTILFMNIYTFSQVVVWIAGNVTYLFIISLLLGYFYYIINYSKSKKKIIILLSVLNFIMTMFVEHMAIILIFGNILILIARYLKTKKIDKEIMLYLVISIIGTLLMLFSPGSLKRSSMENISFSKLSLFSKIFYNIPNFIYYTFIVNSFLIILLSIGNYYLIKKNIKNKLLKILSFMYMLIIPLITCVSYLLNNFLDINVAFFANQNSIILSIYYISYIIISLILLFFDTRKDKNKQILFFYILGISSNVIMLVSPTWGYRTSFATYIFLAISYLFIIDKYIKENKIFTLLLYSVICLISCFYLILYISVHFQYIDNLKAIKSGIKNKSNVIEIKKYPYFSNCNINPDNEFHLLKYKQYYGIDKDVEIKLIDNNWKYLIFYHK